MAAEPEASGPARPQGRHLNLKRAIAAASIFAAIFLAILFLPTAQAPEETDYSRPQPPAASTPQDLLSRLTPPNLPPQVAADPSLEELDALLRRSAEVEQKGESLAEKMKRLRDQTYIAGLNGSLVIVQNRTDASAAPEAAEGNIRSQLGALRDDLQRAQADLPRLLGAAQGRLGVPGSAAPPPTARASAEDLSPVYLTRAPAQTRGAVLHRGMVIPAILLTGIRSDLPGDIRAQVRRDVLDTVRFDRIAIPRGTAILGTYDQALAVGQNRLFVRWSQLRFPDGSTVDLPESPGVDLSGATGIRDRVNHHLWPIFRDAALLGLVSAGFQLGQPADDRGDGQLSSREIAGGAVAQEFERAAGQLLRRQSDRQPTIRIRPGLNFNVLVTRDLVFPVD